MGIEFALTSVDPLPCSHWQTVFQTPTTLSAGASAYHCFFFFSLDNDIQVLRTLAAEFLLKNGRISFIVSLRIWNHCVRLQMIIVCHMKRYGV